MNVITCTVAHALDTWNSSLNDWDRPEWMGKESETELTFEPIDGGLMRCPELNAYFSAEEVILLLDTSADDDDTIDAWITQHFVGWCNSDAHPTAAKGFVTWAWDSIDEVAESLKTITAELIYDVHYSITRADKAYEAFPLTITSAHVAEWLRLNKEALSDELNKHI